MTQPKRSKKEPAPLTEKQILAWADAEFKRLGRWPRCLEGSLGTDPAETWKRIDEALRRGIRGLPGGTSLPRLLSERRGARNRQDLPPLTEEQILAWADDHFKRFGRWPRCGSGDVPAEPAEKWGSIDMALRTGLRGLRGGTSLPRLLASRRKVRNFMEPPRLTERKIIRWAKSHFTREGKWPGYLSGPIAEAPGETWAAVNHALKNRSRGLTGRKQTLAQFLALHCGLRHHRNAPRLTVTQILRWADAHRARTGEWPHAASGPVVDAPGETWLAIDRALQVRGRGLKKRLTLRQLLRCYRGAT